MDDGSRATPMVMAGLDLGDQYSYLLCLIDSGTGRSWKRAGCVPPKP
jgi:hypothetical protein